MHRSRSSAIAVVLGACLTQAVQAQPGDVKRGADVFAAQCSECHSARAGKNKKGPTLFAVMGRRAGETPDFKYSDAMRQSGWNWDSETLQRYLAQPKSALPGGSMKYDGLSDQKALEDLLAYLGTLK